MATVPKSDPDKPDNLLCPVRHPERCATRTPADTGCSSSSPSGAVISLRQQLSRTLSMVMLGDANGAPAWIAWPAVGTRQSPVTG